MGILEEEISKLKAELKKTSDKVKELTNSNEAQSGKVRLLLSNYQKLSKVKDETDGQVNDLIKQKEKLQKEFEDFKENAENEIDKAIANSEPNNETLPWETDAELKDMTAIELRTILDKELSKFQRAKLNEMCVTEMEKELKSKTATESSHIWEISNLKKELQKQKIKLQMYEKPKEATNEKTDKKSTDEVENVKSTLPKPDLNNTAITRMTRSKSKTSVISITSTESPKNLAKKSKISKTSLLAQENNVTNAPSLRRGRKTTTMLETTMPENPYDKKGRNHLEPLRIKARP